MISDTLDFKDSLFLVHMLWKYSFTSKLFLPA